MSAAGCDVESLGIVGFGAFGSFAADHLRQHFDVIVTDTDDRAAAARQAGLGWAALDVVARCDAVVLSVPVQALCDTLDAVAPLLSAGTLVADVASVKIEPARWMLERLPAECEIIGTHPLFGPRSAVDGLAGHRIAICPLRTERTPAIQAFLERLGLEVIVTDPDTHDRQAAKSQAVAQYLGRALHDLQIDQYPIRTRTAELFAEAGRLMAGDSPELFDAIQHLNPHAAEARAELRERLVAWIGSSPTTD